MGLFSFIKNLFKKQQHKELPITIDKAVIEAAKETPLKIVKAPKKEVVETQITDAVTTEAPKKRSTKKVTK
jgi:hypothetical protein